MAIQEKYIIMCDEVRIELNGKFFLIGVYTPDMAVTQLPTIVPVLTFFVMMNDDRPDRHQFRVSIQHLETGQIVGQGMGGFQTGRPGLIALPVRISPIQFASAGAYTFSLYMDDARDPMTYSFNVLLNVVQQQLPGGGMVGPR